MLKSKKKKTHAETEELIHEKLIYEFLQTEFILKDLS